MIPKTHLWSMVALFLGLSLAAAACAEPNAQSFTDLELEAVADDFTSPHLLVTPRGDRRRFVVDLVGRIVILDDDGTPRDPPFLDISDRMVPLRESYDERGLLALAFHPEYQKNGRFFVYYSAPRRDGAPDGWDHTGHLAEFRRSDDPDRADPASERIIMQNDQPQFNHNGARLDFGPDGYLYVGLGDGGAAGDVGMGHPPLGHGQDVTTLLGSVLRIGVDREPYSIPDDNPLVGKQLPDDVEYQGDEPRPEIWAWGIRATWGMAFDRRTGHLFLADVGQDMWEEVNLMKQPGNYGWRLKEGTHGFDPNDMQRVIEDGPDTGHLGEPLIDPIIEYRNARGHGAGVGICVIGGHVYRGKAIEGLQGHYVFGDWTSRRQQAAGVVIVARPPEDDAGAKNERWPHSVAITLDQYVLGFGEDADNELYVLTTSNAGPAGTTGRVWRIVGKGERGTKRGN